MRSILIASLVAATSAYRDGFDIDTEWASYPDRTAQWSEEQANGCLPELAETITTVVANKSSIVKLECVGCPFRVRKPRPEPEEWQNPPQDNSMLLNFTIDASTSALQLNGQPIAPLDPMPLLIHAFQVKANLSSLELAQAERFRLMDGSWNSDTEYGAFELQYEHTIVGTREPGKSWIQFDVTGILYTPEIFTKNPNAHYELRAEGQNLVQILLHETAEPHELFIEDVQVVDRKDRVQPYKMDCGRLAMAQTKFNPLEWDGFGQFGTWSRWFNVLWSNVGSFFGNILVLLRFLVVLAPVILLFRWRARQQQHVNAVPVGDDAALALLVGENADAPPDFEDVSQEHVEGEKV